MDARELLGIARVERHKAYCPYSNYQVGAAVLSESGEVFGGCNIENCNYGGSVCAERVAILKCISTGARKIKKLAVVIEEGRQAKPCGFCRQVMAEFATPDFELILAWDNEEYIVLTLDEILPFAFKPDDLEM
ncbi:MAG: cytidine deaminase [Eubacteriales bacterium]|nr:cytidine deaminase [Eubacteriales bacterium]